MRTALLLSSVLVVLAPACKPDLGAPPSLIEGPRILAVRGVPAEAPEGSDVTYDMLAVDVTGRIASPAVTWAVCGERKPPAETNAVSAACLDLTKVPDQAGPAPTFTAPMLSDACKKFGPQPDVDENKVPVRPHDPDVTGGFYQPVRAGLDLGGFTAIAFAMERIKCRLANAPSDVAAMVNASPPNKNPALARLTLDPDGTPVDLVEAGQPPAAPVTVSPSSPFALELAWTADTPETFPVWNAATEMLEMHREALSVSWYVTGGTFDHDRTGRDEDEADQPTRNVWLAPATPGIVHLWVVLRDSRGGVDFAEGAVEVVAP
jgi:hypothetical protein